MGIESMITDVPSPTCHKSAKSSCIKNGHLRKCSVCHENYPPALHPHGCPYCEQKRQAEAARQKKEDDKKKKDGDKKKKSDNGEGSSSGKRKTKK